MGEVNDTACPINDDIPDGYQAIDRGQYQSVDDKLHYQNANLGNLALLGNTRISVPPALETYHGNTG